MKRILLFLTLVTTLFLAGCQLFHRHELIHYDAVKATCTDDGHSSYNECRICHEITGYEVLPATGHDLVDYWRKEATREESGHSTYSACKNCDYTCGYEELLYVYSLEDLLPPFDDRPYIDCLSKEDYGHIKGLYNAIKNFQPSYGIFPYVDIKKMDLYMYILQSSFPELMQLSYYYNYKYSGDYITSITFTYLMDEEEYQDASETIAKEVLSIVRQTEGMSEFETERFLYEYIINHCSYDKTTTHCGSVYGFFTDKKAKCDGYSKTFMLLLSAAGIECHCVIGNTEDDVHSWNIVKIDDVYYYADPTWDDDEEFPFHYAFLNLDLATMQKSGHELLDFYAENAPECNSLELYVPYQNGTYICEEQDVNTRLHEICNAFVRDGEWNLYLKTETPEHFQFVKDNLLSVMDIYNKKYKKTISCTIISDETLGFFRLKVKYIK